MPTPLPSIFSFATAFFTPRGCLLFLRLLPLPLSIYAFDYHFFSRHFDYFDAFIDFLISSLSLRAPFIRFIFFFFRQRRCHAMPRCCRDAAPHKRRSTCCQVLACLALPRFCQMLLLPYMNTPAAAAALFCRDIRLRDGDARHGH